MNSNNLIKEEALLPSSILDEIHNSENESDSNSSYNFNEKLSLFNEQKNNESSNQVTHYKIIFIHFIYRKKMKQK
jgi:hypothetical protein